MLVGDGMMARAFAGMREDDRVVVFASGVSNSLETDRGAFERETSLLLKTRAAHPDRLFVYFGTCSVEDPDRRNTPYVAHKLRMESLLGQSPSPWMVLRLPLAIGPGRHGHTLAPFLYDRIRRGARFEVWEHATRYPVDVDDVLRVATHLVQDDALWNRPINVALRPFRVLDFVASMQRIVGRPALYDVVPKGRHYDVDCPEVKALASVLKLDYSENYLDRVLRKYFAD